MKAGRLIRTGVCAAVAAVLLAGAGAARVGAQDHAHMSKQPEPSQEPRGKAGALVKAVREATERFKNVGAAEAEGYNLMFGCVNGPDFGAMGLHYVNLGLVGDGEIDVAKPEIVLYEPLPKGGVRITGADYLVFADQWNATHTSPPEIMGQLMHLFEAPNRFGLPAFYTLHVWAWKESPIGSFVNWHPHVTCDSYAAK